MLIKNAILPQNLRRIIDNYKSFFINTYQIKLLSNKKIHLLTMKLLYYDPGSITIYPGKKVLISG